MHVRSQLSRQQALNARLVRGPREAHVRPTGGCRGQESSQGWSRQHCRGKRGQGGTAVRCEALPPARERTRVCVVARPCSSAPPLSAHLLEGPAVARAAAGAGVADDGVGVARGVCQPRGSDLRAARLGVGVGAAVALGLGEREDQGAAWEGCGDGKEAGQDVRHPSRRLDLHSQPLAVRRGRAVVEASWRAAERRRRRAAQAAARSAALAGPHLSDSAISSTTGRRVMAARCGGEGGCVWPGREEGACGLDEAAEESLQLWWRLWNGQRAARGLKSCRTSEGRVLQLALAGARPQTPGAALGAPAGARRSWVAVGRAPSPAGALLAQPWPSRRRARRRARAADVGTGWSLCTPPMPAGCSHQAARLSNKPEVSRRPNMLTAENKCLQRGVGAHVKGGQKPAGRGAAQQRCNKTPEGVGSGGVMGYQSWGGEAGGGPWSGSGVAPAEQKGAARRCGSVTLQPGTGRAGRHTGAPQGPARRARSRRQGDLSWRQQGRWAHARVGRLLRAPAGAGPPGLARPPSRAARPRGAAGPWTRSRSPAPWRPRR